MRLIIATEQIVAVMSGLLAFTYCAASLPLPAALQRLAPLGGDEERLWTGEDAVVAVTRKSWEMADDFSGPEFVLAGEDLVVAADATLYDRPGLMHALSAARVAPRGSTSSHLIEAAYLAWGPSLVDHLTGDYAFIIWDRKRRQVVAARDPCGSRALFYSPASGIALSSSSRALAELHGRSRDLNVDRLAAQAAGLAWSLGTDTCVRGVFTVLPGHLLIGKKGRVVQERFWHPPTAPAADHRDLTEATQELRWLLRAVVADRLGSGPNSVWMSGGWDSTAVFSAGQLALQAPDRARLRPVSIRFPVGDPACEDDLIMQVADRWKASVHWVDGKGIALLDGLEERAAGSDEPPPALFESAHRALGRGSRAIGARVALGGRGGDQLFAVSEIVLADLLRTGRWIEFVRFARSRHLGARSLLRASVRPQLPEFVLRASEKYLGRRVQRHYLERPRMPWVRRTFVEQERLLDREVAVLTAVRGGSLSQSESIAHVTAPFWGFAASYVHRTLLGEGVELRSPLMDRRIVEFALARPVAERANHAGTKLLLRRAMEGLVPPAVLAPRPRRTGMTAEFGRWQMDKAYPRLFAELFDRPLRLADLGIVDPTALKEGADRFFAAGSDESLGAGLFSVLNVELWLRGLDRRNAAPASTEVAREAPHLVPAA